MRVARCSFHFGYEPRAKCWDVPSCCRPTPIPILYGEAISLRTSHARPVWRRKRSSCWICGPRHTSSQNEAGRCEEEHEIATATGAGSVARSGARPAMSAVSWKGSGPPTEHTPSARGRESGRPLRSQVPGVDPVDFCAADELHPDLAAPTVKNPAPVRSSVTVQAADRYSP